MFERVQDLRLPHVQLIAAMSHERQLMDTMATPEFENLMMNKFHKIMSRVMIDRWDSMFGPAISLDMFPTPDTKKASWLFKNMQEEQAEDSKIRSSL